MAFDTSRTTTPRGFSRATSPRHIGGVLHSAGSSAFAAAPVQLQGRARAPVFGVPKEAPHPASRQSDTIQTQPLQPGEIDRPVEPTSPGSARWASKRLNFRLEGSKVSAHSNEGSKATNPSSAGGGKSRHLESEVGVMFTEARSVVSNESSPVNKKLHQAPTYLDMLPVLEKERRPSWSDLLSTTVSPMTSPTDSRPSSKRASERRKGSMESVSSNEGHKRSATISTMDEITQQSKSRISIEEFRPVSSAGRPSRRSSKDLRLSALRANREATPKKEELPVMAIEQAVEPVKQTTILHRKDLFVICQELNVPYALGREAARLWRQHVPGAMGDVLINGRMPIKIFRELQGQQLSTEETTSDSSAAELDLKKKDHINFHEFVQWFFTNGFRDEINIFDESTEQRYLKKLAKTHNVSLLDVESCNDKFKKTDLNGNGTIEYDEFEVLVHSMIGLACGKQLPHARMHTLWRDADIDGNGSLDFEEFMAFWIKSFRGMCPIEGFYRSFRRPGTDLSLGHKLPFMQ